MAANNETLSGKHLILWYFSGFGHRPIAEQYPVMNMEAVSVALRPHNFFNENPSLYVKKSTA